MRSATTAAVRIAGLAFCVAATAWADTSSMLRLRTVDDAGGAVTARAEIVAAVGRFGTSVATGANGTASFARLPPGAYELTVTAPERETGRAVLRLAPGEALLVRVVLGAEAFRIEIEDRTARAYGAVFEAERLEGLPGSRTVWSLLETTEAGAILDRIAGAGLYPGEPGRLGMHGSSWTQTSLRMGDADVTDPLATGTPLLLPDVDALESLAITSAAAPVEDGGSGPTLSALLRRPGGAWHGSLRSQFALPGLQPDGVSDPPAIARLEALDDVGITADGPLVDDRLGLLLSGRLERSRRRERDEPGTLRAHQVSLLTQVTATPSARDELRAAAAFQDGETPAAGRGRVVPADAFLKRQALHLQAAWDRLGPTSWTTIAAYQRDVLEPRIDGILAGGVVERLRDGPVLDLLPTRSTRERWDVGATFAPAIGGGRHAVRVGATLGGSRATARVLDVGGPIGETVAGLPARVWQVETGAESRWRSTELAFFAGDRLTLGRVEVDGGARFESTTASAEGGDRISWRALLPRVSGRWRVAGPFAFTAAWGRYRHRLPLSLLAFGDPSAPRADVRLWRDDGDGSLEVGEVGRRVARTGPGGDVAAIDADLAPPRTEEVLVGVEGTHGERVRWRFTALRRRERDLVESVDVGVGTDGYSVRLVPDPAGDLLGPGDDQLLPVYDRNPATFGDDRYVLTNPPDHNALYEGVELSFGTRWGRGVRLGLGGSAFRASGYGGNRGFLSGENDQGVVGEQFDDPNAVTFGRGRLFFDRAYILKLWGLWDAPGGVRLGAVARYHDGQPFARLVVVPDLRQGPEAVQAVPNGRHRFTYTFTLDARVEKSFAVGARRAAAVVEAFNLTASRLEVEEDVVWGPGFRRVTAVQPPRAVRLGLRVEF